MGIKHLAMRDVEHRKIDAPLTLAGYFVPSSVLHSGTLLQ
jgi:hypothetical protein